MASYKGHSAGGIAAAAVFLGGFHHFFSFQPDWVDILVFLVTGLLGALFPDVDTNSRGQDIFYSLFFLLDFSFIALRKFEYAALLGLLVILPVLGRHRGWTHTWWAMLIVPFPDHPAACGLFQGRSSVIDSLLSLRCFRISFPPDSRLEIQIVTERNPFGNCPLFSRGGVFSSCFSLKPRL